MRGITISLDGANLSDLYFNFEHPERAKLYDNSKDDIDLADLERADRADAESFADILDIPKHAREEFIAELITDFTRRI